MKDTGGYVRDAKELQIMQSYPLWMKVMLTKQRIREWVYQFGEDSVVVSFSGGKDSTVLLHLVREEFPNVRAVFSNTGLEYPEIQHFVKSFDSVDIVTPKMLFNEVISTYGYPLISKEVAEAIYYARRIRAQDVNVERDSRTSIEQYKRTELFGKRTTRYSRPESSPCGNEANQVVDEPTKSMFNKEKWLPLARDVPVLISGLCCNKTKKEPIHAYYRKQGGLMPFLAMLAEESRMRTQAWIRHGCNAFDSKRPTSNPLSFWTEQDILRYIVDNADSMIEMRRKAFFERVGSSDLNTVLAIGMTVGETLERDYSSPIASVYGDIVAVDSFGNEYDPHGTIIDCKLKCTGCQRTGCLYCPFGSHLEKGETRFQRLAKTHPRQYEYCIGGGQWVDNPHYDPTAPKMDGEWENWNPKKIWVPSKQGLGMGKVFDIVNEIYGKDFYRYE